MLRLVSSEHFNECALCGCLFNISVPSSQLGRDISVAGSCERVKCPDTGLRMQCTKMRIAKAVWCLGPRTLWDL